MVTDKIRFDALYLGLVMIVLLLIYLLWGKQFISWAFMKMYEFFIQGSPVK